MAHLLAVSIPKKVRLVYDLDRSLPAVNADSTQLRQIVMNLITNAAEAIGDADGAIAVRVYRREVDEVELAAAHAEPSLAAGRLVCLEVEDTGSGMDPETVRRIFDPFFTTKFAGRGLGLASMLGIVQRHRGAISVTSAPGQGTTFRILLPPCDHVLPTPPVPTGSEPAAAGGTVLIVDDEDGVRSVVRAMLERSGYRPLTAANGQEAFDVFRSRPGEVDLVLLDMTMPVMDGAETLAAIRSVRSDVPVLLSSGHSETDAPVDPADGTLAFIQKPYRHSELLDRIASLLGHAGGGNAAPAASS
jgi:CheY-like chemotaxis protein